MRKLSYEEVKNNIENEGYKLISKEYINNNTHLLVQCDKSHKFNITWNDFKHGIRCSYCSNKKALLGWNTIYDTDPWMIKLGVSEEDAKKYTYGSSQKITVICPDCGNPKDIVINKIYSNHSIGCNCGDGAYYPEKIMYNLLTQLNIKFITQLNSKQFSWCDKYKYDFYLPDYNTIIETNGEQHYNNSFKSVGGKTIEEQQKIDKIKKELAFNNGINKYIIIDCRKSDLEFIKQNILNSELNNLFDLSKIDWNKCEGYALSNLVKEVCDYWNNKKEYETTKHLAEYFNLSINCIARYLKKGTKLGWCNYNPKEESKKGHIKAGKKSPLNNPKKVICITTNKLFNSIREAEKYYNIDNIGACCRGKYKSAGKLPDGTPLVWAYA